MPPKNKSLQIAMVPWIRPYVLIKLAYPQTLLSISSVEDGHNKDQEIAIRQKSYY